MPEGDTIYRTAARLRPVLQGQAIVAAAGNQPACEPSTLVGRTVREVEARGKHLLIHLDDRRAIHSHLGMHGAWHLYRPGQPWTKPQRWAALTLEVPAAVCVCFSPKTLELLTAAGLERHPQLTKLGPDLLAAHVDVVHVVQRFRAQPDRPVGEAVMDQTVVCGIGNVYKSELLFLCRLDPFQAIRQISDEDLVRLIERAIHWMSRNLEGHPRQTRFGLDGPKHWVYGRSGQPCFECGTRIAVRRQGDLGRTTYWCPQCQGGESTR
jgi:endonuclease-8